MTRPKWKQGELERLIQNGFFPETFVEAERANQLTWVDWAEWSKTHRSGYDKYYGALLNGKGPYYPSEPWWVDKDAFEEGPSHDLLLTLCEPISA